MINTRLLALVLSVAGVLISSRLAAADIPVELRKEVDDSDLVVLSASQGRSLVGIKGFGGNEVLDRNKILVLRLTAKEGEPGLIIKRKDSPRFTHYYIKNGSIAVNGGKFKISDLLEAMKIPKDQVPSVFIGENP